MGCRRQRGTGGAVKAVAVVRCQRGVGGIPRGGGVNRLRDPRKVPDPICVSACVCAVVQMTVQFVGGRVAGCFPSPPRHSPYHPNSRQNYQQAFPPPPPQPPPPRSALKLECAGVGKTGMLVPVYRVVRCWGLTCAVEASLEPRHQHATITFMSPTIIAACGPSTID